MIVQGVMAGSGGKELVSKLVDGLDKTVLAQIDLGGIQDPMETEIATKAEKNLVDEYRRRLAAIDGEPLVEPPPAPSSQALDFIIRKGLQRNTKGGYSVPGVVGSYTLEEIEAQAAKPAGSGR